MSLFGTVSLQHCFQQKVLVQFLNDAFQTAGNAVIAQSHKNKI